MNFVEVRVLHGDRTTFASENNFPILGIALLGARHALNETRSIMIASLVANKTLVFVENRFDLLEAVFKLDSLFSTSGNSEGILTFGKAIESSRWVSIYQIVSLLLKAKAVFKKIETVSTVKGLVMAWMFLENESVLLKQSNAGVVFEKPQGGG